MMEYIAYKKNRYIPISQNTNNNTNIKIKTTRKVRCFISMAKDSRDIAHIKDKSDLYCNLGV